MKAWTQYRPKPVIGVDEVGRGSLAGPVFAAAVVLKHERLPKFLKDSKLLSRKQRIDVFREICHEHQVAIGIATVEEIAMLNIVYASMLAMKRAITGLRLKKGHVLVDGRLRIPVLPKEFQQTPVVKGDLLFAPVSAASIIAKVARDELMAELGKEFPHYGWEHNAGYATAAHIKALREHGPCRLHRKSFSQVSLPFIL
ncbi:ribonuclease HII [Bdellovibrio sp. KM01]|uniref:ribonuclease HII n=1 Tax=Bdellovibrio sp. KM01 TaxID=2748865 RepID=UPI0015EA8B86|nr:ribonuclease HII [Bdellovibrio sp. KM01]QLY26248.1 ribonuclease HII [Bdellovibrio sp. KM01]